MYGELKPCIYSKMLISTIFFYWFGDIIQYLKKKKKKKKKNQSICGTLHSS